jgi:hypothetical protein
VPFSDRPPAFVFPDTELGRAKMREFIAEEPDALIGAVVACNEYVENTTPIYTDADWLRDKSIPMCARRNRDGVRDMNWCCRCAAGLPFTPTEKAHEVYSDSAIRL